MTRRRQRPRLAVFKFASCDGCQLSLLDCEDELLAVAGAVEIANFAEATRAVVKGPYDVTLVEGSITTAHDAQRIHEVRKASKRLLTIGACATAGGIQALKNFADVREFARAVYPTPELVSSLETSTPIAQHVKVDLELRGCPIDKGQLLAVLGALLRGDRPRLATHNVCIDCKRHGTVCLMVARGIPCLVPVTQTGCGAFCPAYGRGCYGCFGPMDTPTAPALGEALCALGLPHADVARAFRTFNAWAGPFRSASESHEHR